MANKRNEKFVLLFINRRELYSVSSNIVTLKNKKYGLHPSNSIYTNFL